MSHSPKQEEDQVSRQFLKESVSSFEESTISPEKKTVPFTDSSTKMTAFGTEEKDEKKISPRHRNSPER